MALARNFATLYSESCNTGDYDSRKLASMRVPVFSPDANSWIWMRVGHIHCSRAHSLLNVTPNRSSPNTQQWLCRPIARELSIFYSLSSDLFGHQFRFYEHFNLIDATAKMVRCGRCKNKRNEQYILLHCAFFRFVLQL